MVHDKGILAALDCISGEPRLIGEVVSGKACNCYCPHPGCGSRLVAKKGESMAHHFAHSVVPANMRPCHESALHLCAKIAAAHSIRHLRLPDHQLPIESSEKAISPAGHWETWRDTLTIGVVEPLVPEISPYRPDVRFDTPFGPLYIEIRVTHAVSPEKQQAMADESLSVLEVDLSQIPRAGLSQQAIEDLVANKAPRHWVSCGADAAEDIRKAQETLDNAVREHEAQQHQKLMARLRESLSDPLAESVHVDSFRSQPTVEHSVLMRRVSVMDVRRRSGFTLANFLGMENVLVTTVDDEVDINRLFTWHRSHKNHGLTVLSIGRRNIIHTNSPDHLKLLNEYRDAAGLGVSSVRHRDIMAALKERWPAHLPDYVKLQRVHNMANGTTVRYGVNIGIKSVREWLGFRIANLTLPAPKALAHDVVITGIDNRQIIQYLFDYFRSISTPGRKLTVLTLANKVSIYTDSRVILQRLGLD